MRHASRLTRAARAVPACLGTVSRASNIILALHDNLLQGTVPATLTALQGISLAYNPFLVGALPSGFTAGKLLAWSSYYAKLYQAYMFGSSITYGGGSYGTGVVRGTSLGLDRPMRDILLDILAAMDPLNSSGLSASWRPTDAQPCAPWRSSNNNPPQNSSSPVRAASELRRGCACWLALTHARSVLPRLPPRRPMAAAGWASCAARRRTRITTSLWPLSRRLPASRSCS